MLSTTIEMSNKLLESGLDPNTADMYWEYDYNEHTYNNVPRVLVVKNWDDEYNKNIPSWTLSALLELMPKLVSRGYEKSYPKIVRHNFTDKYFGHCLHYDTDMFDSPVEAAYDMTVWLLEHGMIQQNKVKIKYDSNKH